MVFLQAERMSRGQYQPDDPEPWRIGAGRRNPTPSAPSTATQAEALNAAWDLARRLGNEPAAERYAQAALRAVQFLMREQHTEASGTAYSRPERAMGAWSQDRNRSVIRFDFVQHGLSGLDRRGPPAGCGGQRNSSSERTDGSSPDRRVEILEVTTSGRRSQSCG